MKKTPYQNFHVHYPNSEKGHDTKLPPKKGSGDKIQFILNFLHSFSYEKFTIMLIPHNEAKMVHFHISLITILFFVLLFIILISVSMVSIQLQSQIKNQANNLQAEVKTIRKNLYLFKKSITKIDSQMVRFKKDFSASLQAVTGNPRKSNYIYSDDYSKIFPSQNRKIPDFEYRRLIQLQRDFSTTTSQLQELRLFLSKRDEIIDFTPSIWPVKGQITSLFGRRRDPFTYKIRFHSALDIAAPRGSPVYATAPGIVVKKTYSKNYGRFIKIKHRFGFFTQYAHNSEILVAEGERVRKGQNISRVGRTGRTTGDHLHYEIFIKNTAINPYLYLYRQ